VLLIQRCECCPDGLSQEIHANFSAHMKKQGLRVAWNV
jgi:hypothetical protein